MKHYHGIAGITEYFATRNIKHMRELNCWRATVCFSIATTHPITQKQVWVHENDFKLFSYRSRKLGEQWSKEQLDLFFAKHGVQAKELV